MTEYKYQMLANILENTNKDISHKLYLDEIRKINKEVFDDKIWQLMILARLKWNTPLYKVDEFVTKFRDRYKNKQVRIDVKLTGTECLIYLFKRLN